MTDGRGRPQSSVTDGRGLGQGQPIGGHQLTYQATVQLLLMTHRFRGIFRRLAVAVQSNKSQLGTTERDRVTYQLRLNDYNQYADIS